jgi:hypothetical protein
MRRPFDDQSFLPWDWSLRFSPAVHINYAEAVLPMRGGLPKFKDFPAEFGGSGEQLTD